MEHLSIVISSPFFLTGKSKRKKNGLEFYGDLFRKMYGRSFQTIDEVMAHDLTLKLGKTYGFTEDYLLEVLKNKPVSPDNFCYYMDHAFFSTLCLFQK